MNALPLPLSTIDTYPHPDYLIPRIMKDAGHTEAYATLLVREAKRMLYLCVVSGEAVAPSLHVDDAWHAMLMFTRFYKEFGEAIGGFVHHDPTPPGFWETKQKNEGVSLKGGTPIYRKMKENYLTYFGEAPDPACWP